MKPLFASERFSVDSDAEALSDPSGAPDHFERELRCALPDALRFESAAVSGVGTEPLRLLRIERERDAMHVKYVSYAEGGASPVATLSGTRLTALTRPGLFSLPSSLLTVRLSPVTPLELTLTVHS